jgi:hypothetical protein
MVNFKNPILSFLTLLSAAGFAQAGISVDQQPLGPDGQLFGGARSAQGNHLALFACKGHLFWSDDRKPGLATLLASAPAEKTK